MGGLSGLLRSIGLKAPKPKQKAVLSKEEDVRAAATYAEKIFNAYEQLFRERDIPIAGSHYLELGPGRDFGPQLLMVDHVASVTVVDRFLARWDADYHPALYREILARVGGSPAIECVVGQSGYDGVIDLVSAPAEHLQGIPDEKFDIVVSTAVLEHLYDLRLAAREMRRVSKSGAVHLHRVDFRDHRNFARPLEYLLLVRRKFARLAVRANYEFGCQTRPLEFRRIFEEAGYSIDEAEIKENADEEYLDDFMPRLRRSWRSPYRRWNRDDLRAIGVWYWMRA